MRAHRSRRRILILVLVFLGTGYLSAQTQPAKPQLSITLLMDLSYSMRLPLSLDKDRMGRTRLDEAKRLVEAIVKEEGTAAHWSVLTFGGYASESQGKAVNVRLAFTRVGKQVDTVVAKLSTWGVSPLMAAITAAERYSNENAPTSKRIIFVISDGIDTVPTLFEMATAARLRSSSSRVLFAGIKLRDQPGLSARLQSWVRETGGVYVDASNRPGVLRALAALSKGAAVSGEKGTEVAATVRQAATTVKQAASDSRQPPPGPSQKLQDSGSSGGQRAPVWWLLLIMVALVPLPLVVFAAHKWHSRAAQRRALNLRREVVTFRFWFEHRGRGDEVAFHELPATLAFGRETAEGRNRPELSLEGGRLSLSMKSSLVVNGVARRETILSRGDRIHTTDGVWTYRGAAKQQIGPPIPKPPRGLFYYLSSVFFAVALVAVVMSYVVRLPTGGVPTVSSALQTPSNNPKIVTVSKSEHQPLVSALVGNASIPQPFVHTEMIGPNALPHYFKADVMFIHTHPDDESIDFGGLMALESRSGRRIVTVIFTDGTAGLDQFPNRRVGGRYPDHRLRGAALAKVRVQEAESALSILGSREYIRLGLVNNPYDSIREILPLHEVLKRWGGDAKVVAKLVSLLEGFQPQIVVSPDKLHPGVFKHFEHEAVGYVTDQALSYLRSHGKDFVQAHLIAVDPMLTAEYKGVFGVDVMAVDPKSGLTYRAIQVEALKQHVTQRDASVIGVEVVTNFADEYYVADSWRLAQSPAQYFRPPSAPTEQSAGVHSGSSS